MEFRLNKIDMNVRQRINEETKEGKIHTKKGLTINSDKEKEKRQQNPNKEEKEEKEKFIISKYVSENKKSSVEATKEEEIYIEAHKEDNTSDASQYIGRFIDIRR